MQLGTMPLDLTRIAGLASFLQDWHPFSDANVKGQYRSFGQEGTRFPLRGARHNDIQMVQFCGSECCRVHY